MSDAPDRLAEAQSAIHTEDWQAFAVAILAHLRETAVVAEHMGGREVLPRIRWQCSGCRWGFAGAYQDVCPACGKVKYWSGSVHPSAKLWEGPYRETMAGSGSAQPNEKRVPCKKHPRTVPSDCQDCARDVAAMSPPPPSNPSDADGVAVAGGRPGDDELSLICYGVTKGEHFLRDGHRALYDAGFAAGERENGAKWIRALAAAGIRAQSIAELDALGKEPPSVDSAKCPVCLGNKQIKVPVSGTMQMGRWIKCPDCKGTGLSAQPGSAGSEEKPK